ncbi:MAG: Rossman fold protein, TIGR00730 family [Bacteroidetes bacterium 4572_117]|nr:MAG: Rossman fold protein, TIGR00730 family [Bacteroidetes bacterium 4572_117]
MEKICVFCGSSKGNGSVYLNAATELANELVKRNLGLIYGGASVGTMGQIANTVLEQGGKVTGIMPKVLVEKEVALTKLTDFHVVGSMHERKAMMADLSDAFIALPGGFGTLDEIFEILTWAQLEFHHKPCGILNINGYYDKLIEFLDNMVNQGFLMIENRQMIIIENNPVDLLNKFELYTPPKVDKAEWALKN